MIYENLYMKSFSLDNCKNYGEGKIEYVASRRKYTESIDVSILKDGKEITSATISNLKILISFTKQAKKAFKLKTTGV